jgi:hypothetical protein
MTCLALLVVEGFCWHQWLHSWKRKGLIWKEHTCNFQSVHKYKTSNCAHRRVFPELYPNWSSTLQFHLLLILHLLLLLLPAMYYTRWPIPVSYFPPIEFCNNEKFHYCYISSCYNKFSDCNNDVPLQAIPICKILIYVPGQTSSATWQCFKQITLLYYQLSTWQISMWGTY